MNPAEKSFVGGGRDVTCSSPSERETIDSIGRSVPLRTPELVLGRVPAWRVC